MNTNIENTMFKISVIISNFLRLDSDNFQLECKTHVFPIPKHVGTLLTSPSKQSHKSEFLRSMHLDYLEHI